MIDLFDLTLCKGYSSIFHMGVKRKGWLIFQEKYFNNVTVIFNRRGDFSLDYIV